MLDLDFNSDSWSFFVLENVNPPFLTLTPQLNKPNLTIYAMFVIPNRSYAYTMPKDMTFE
jgi:hypothetical protein